MTAVVAIRKQITMKEKIRIRWVSKCDIPGDGRSGLRSQVARLSSPKNSSNHFVLCWENPKSLQDNKGRNHNTRKCRTVKADTVACSWLPTPGKVQGIQRQINIYILQWYWISSCQSLLRSQHTNATLSTPIKSLWQLIREGVTTREK